MALGMTPVAVQTPKENFETSEKKFASQSVNAIQTNFNAIKGSSSNMHPLTQFTDHAYRHVGTQRKFCN